MLSRFVGIAEILVSLFLIFRVATGSATSRDYLIFAAISLLYTISMARQQKERRARHKEISDAKARQNYDKKRYAQMRKELEEMDETEYETHPINVQEFSKKLMSGEATLSDMPDTRSRAHREYSEGEGRDRD